VLSCQRLGRWPRVLTSVVTYGTLSLDEQADIFGDLANDSGDPGDEVIAIARQLVA